MTIRKRNKTSGNAATSTPKLGATKKVQTLTRSLGIHASTLYAVAILLLAMATSVVWNAVEKNRTDPAIRSFLKTICDDSNVYCSDAIHPVRRTQKATRHLSAGVKLVEIPRHLLIWDLDALRNGFVQQELGKARIFDQPLEADAFLAAYLALLRHSPSLVSPGLQEYLAILPTIVDFDQFHPLLLARRLRGFLAERSYTYQSIMYKRKMIQLEYEAFTNASETFMSHCPWSDYMTARLAVLTRSFGTGPLHENEHDTTGKFPSLQEELDFYREKTGVDLSKGSFAMVPILDLYNHHANPTVGYAYDPVKRAFEIKSLGLQPGQELWDSYGKHSDPHLYMKFGFINGDCSEPTQASLAAWHSLFILPNETRNEELLRYMSFDDGYSACIQRKDGDPWVLKRLKFQHLLAMAHKPFFWTVVAKPRKPDARPGMSSETSADWPPRNELFRLNKRSIPNLDGVHALCRLLAVTNEDLDGRAVQLLTDNLGQAGEYVLPHPEQGGGFEYRTLACIDRLAAQSMGYFQTSLVNAEARLTTASADLRAETRTEWTLANLEMGELVTLDLIRGMVRQTLMEVWPNESDRRKHAVSPRPICESDLLDPLLDEVA